MIGTATRAILHEVTITAVSYGALPAPGGTMGGPCDAGHYGRL
jgi:hypothetical protein